eukprot:CAMPEP_0181324450 /NCGR_PEP_ID=MMETSP1101-20121128/20367_1 /TAXON_ID=46948 /ORGANISM="Rhodomonas abbreviata, Strain Caron Lab Isolate" /LENGTH=206 /DNA_ID=CAMNT_0023432629 /DNA_START=53 /DNA_END=669 /DNA_ORIENTATION=+
MTSPSEAMAEMGLSVEDFNMSGSQISTDEKNKAQKIMDACMKMPENRHCADCNALGPRWASMNLGIFFCLNCSGIHRRLGVHISKVKSVTLDGWKIKWAQWMKERGNKKSNEYWEATMAEHKKPTESSSSMALEEFIRAKYERKEWVPVGGSKPKVQTDDAKKKQEEADRKLAEKFQKELNMQTPAPAKPAAKPAPAPAAPPAAPA